MPKKIIGIILIVIGLMSFGTGVYIKHEVNKGRQQIRDAEKKVDTGKKLFSVIPGTKKAGKIIMGPIEKRIREGSAEASYYEMISIWLKIGGVVFIIGGTGLLFLAFKKK